MQERASGLGLGWERSFFVGEDCVDLGAIDFGVVFPLDLPLDCESLSLFLSCLSGPHTLHSRIDHLASRALPTLL